MSALLRFSHFTRRHNVECHCTIPRTRNSYITVASVVPQLIVPVELYVNFVFST